MEKFEDCFSHSIKTFKLADHLVQVTYPLIKDPKLLLNSMENIYSSLEKAMEGLLYYEYYYKRIPYLPKEFELRFNILKQHLAKKYNLSPDHINLIREIREIILLHQKSKVEFRKHDEYIICNGDYSLKRISLPQVKEYLKKTKEFLKQVYPLLKK